MLTILIVTVLAVELFARLPFLSLGRQLSAVVVKTLKVMKSSLISDHWKEKVLLRYAGILASTTLRLAAYLTGIGVALALVSTLLDMAIQPDIATLTRLMTWEGLTVATIASLIQLSVRPKLVR